MFKNRFNWLKKTIYLLLIGFFVSPLGVGVGLERAHAAEPTSHIVISEIQITGDGVNDSTDEFVELYNPTNGAIVMTNWRLTRKTSTGPENNLVSDLNGTIPGNGFFLIAHPDYNGSVSADVLYSASSNSITNNHTVLLYSDAGTTLIDKVGMGTAGDFEGAATSNPAANGSIERKPGEASSTQGNGIDTDNNSNDFATRTVSEPQNSSNAIEDRVLGPTNPTAIDTPSDTGGSITVTWTKSVDDGAGDNAIDWYNVYRREEINPAFSLIKDKLAAGTESYIDATTTDGTYYIYRIETVDENSGYSAFSGETGAVTSEDNTPATPPTPPSSEITNPDGHTRLSEFNLEVQTSENTAGLYLYYNKDGKGWTQYGDLYAVANPNVRTYITFRSKENGLGDGNYGFYTIAVDAAGNREGEPAFPDLNVTVDTNPPAAPVGYMVPGSPSMDNTPTAMGEISSDTYRVWLEITSHATGEKIIVNGSLIDNKRYEATPNAEQVLADGAYQIIAFAEDYLGNGSMYVIATDYVIDTVGAEVPTGLKAIGGAGEVYLEWQAMEGISNYLLKYRKAGEDYGEPMLILGQSNTQIIGLENGVEYEFAVASVDAAGNVSEYSTVKVLIKVGQISTADGTGAVPSQYPAGGPEAIPTVAKGPEVVAVPVQEKPATKVEEEVTQPEQKEGEPAEITPIQPEEPEEGQVKAEETKTTRNWTRIIVAISILIIAIGVGTGGWYGYQWLTERGKADTGLKGMDDKKDDKDKKDEGKPNEPSGRW